jgi:hypothetical protein
MNKKINELLKNQISNKKKENQNNRCVVTSTIENFNGKETSQV